MTEDNRKQLGKTFWSIADCLSSVDDLIEAQDVIPAGLAFTEGDGKAV